MNDTETQEIDNQIEDASTDDVVQPTEQNQETVQEVGTEEPVQDTPVDKYADFDDKQLRDALKDRDEDIRKKASKIAGSKHELRDMKNEMDSFLSKEVMNPNSQLFQELHEVEQDTELSPQEKNQKRNKAVLDTQGLYLDSLGRGKYKDWDAVIENAGKRVPGCIPHLISLGDEELIYNLANNPDDLRESLDPIYAKARSLVKKNSTNKSNGKTIIQKVVPAPLDKVKSSTSIKRNLTDSERMEKVRSVYGR